MVLKKQWFFLGIKILIAGCILIVLIRNVNFRDIWNAFKNPENPFLILLALLLLIPNLFFQWYRWHFLLRVIQPRVSFMESISSLMGGMVIGFVTPGRIGEIGRSLFLKNVDRLQAFGMVFLDKFYSFMTIFIGGLWGMVFLVAHRFGYAGFILWPLCAVGLIVTGVALFLQLHPIWMRSSLYNLSLIFPKRDKFKRLIGCLDNFQKSHARQIVLSSWAVYGIYIIQFCLLAFAFQKTNVGSILSATTATFLAKSLLPISFADLGIREGASIYFFAQYHISKVTAFNSSILLFAMNILIPSFLGLFFLPRLGWTDNAVQKRMKTHLSED